MQFIKELDNLLFDNDVYQKILEDNKARLKITLEIQTYVESKLLLSLNEIMSNVTDKIVNRMNQAIFILFAQGVKSYKAGIIMSMQGYFTNATMILRNLLEITFNIKYIAEDETKRFERANNYLTAKDNWSGETAKLRAYSVLDQYLYKVYGIVCNYVHANYMGTGQNLEDNKQISISPSTEKIKDSLNALNSMYVYLIEFVCEYYKLDTEMIKKFEQDRDIAGYIRGFNTEKEILGMFAEMFKGDDFPENFTEEFIKDYKKFVVDNLKQQSKKNKNKNKNKNKKNNRRK